MNQLTDPYEEIENRLAICCEFLMDREKPIEEAYDSLMGKIGRKIMEYSEFEYWFKRFQNNQFDLGYDTSQDSKEISEIQNTTVKRKIEEFKLDHQFKEENVPEIFQTLINRQSKKLREIDVCFNEHYIAVNLDKLRIILKNRENQWMICYENINDTVIRTNDPEKSIIDHLWFVLRNPSIRLERLVIYVYKTPEFKRNDDFPKNSQKLDFGKLNSLLQSMFNTFGHQIQSTVARCNGFNEDTCLSMLKRVKPGALEEINFEISWKKEGNYQKMEEIVETDQWKQAKKILCSGVTPLKIHDLFHCETFWLEFDRITPEDVLRVIKHFFNSVEGKSCGLSSRNESLDIETIKDVLQNDGTQIIDSIQNEVFFSSKIVKSAKTGFVKIDTNYITIRKSRTY